MTRPSEAEVTELMSVGQCEACGGPTVSLARHICEPCKARALSTPPLPSAEPVAWLREDGAATSPFAKREWPELNAAFTLPVFTTPPLPSAEPRDLSGYCVACGQEAGPHNTYGDAEGRHALNVYPNFSVCDSCLPSSDDTAPLTDEMEPEEAALRCWHNDFTNRCIPFEEIAEQLMRWTALRGTPPLPSAEPVAWPLADEDGRKGGWTYDFAWLERIADEVADEDNGRPCPEIVEGIALRLARTTPPAAAQDTGDDDDSFLADAAPTLLGQLSRKAVQAAVDEATDADGWVRFVDGQVVSRNALLNKLVALDSDAARAAGGE